MKKNFINKELLEKVHTGKSTNKLAIAGAALLALIGGVGAVIYNKKKNQEKNIDEMNEGFPFEDGKFVTLKECDLKAEPDTESETLVRLGTDEILEGVTFKDGWYRVKVKGKDGYLEKNTVVFFYSKFELSKDETDSLTKDYIKE